MDSFEKYLKYNQDKFMSVITPGGNHGDTLIHMSLMKKLEEYEIEYICFNLENLCRDNLLLGAKYLVNIGLWKIGSSLGFKLIDLPHTTKLILFEGGGYMSDIWYGPTLLKQTMERSSAPVAVGPQSYLFSKTKFHQYFTDGRPVHLFCREKYSLEHLEKCSLPGNVSVSLSPELALYLTMEDLEDYIEPRSGSYELISLRKDRESAINETTRNKIIQLSENPLIADISMEKTLTDFISTVYNAEYVYTDRLHVSILSKILGKKATLLGNKYHKNKGVWEYSLRESIEFIEA
jgi:exopolysaccharide biosynthesis predicted pyruvyltransferase EpsI